MKLNTIARLCGAALLAGLASFGAHADNPANGATLYANNCASCHGSSPLTSNSSKIYFGRNARSVIETAIATNNSGMGSLRSAFPTNGTQIADVAAYLGNSPSALSFPSTAVGSTSATTQTVTVAASLKGAAYAISALTVSATGDFARAGGTCATSVAAGTTCTVIVSFTPTVAGARSGTLSIAHSNTLTPVTIALSGTATGAATAPVASITPASLTLASTPIGSTSAAQSVTVSNTGNAALSVSAITPSSAEFIVAGGTCSAGGSVAAGSSCTISMALRPVGAAGARTGSLSIAHNAAGAPGVVSLSGIATAAVAPVASLTASLAFGSVNVGTTSTAQTATLSNTGNAPLTLASIATGSTEFAVSGGTCAAGGSVAAAASCTINLSFTPSAAGARSATLVVAHNAASAQSSTSLSGTGVALAPVIGLSPTTLSFSQAVNTTSVAQSVTLSNTGSAPLSIGALSLGGAQATEFQLAAGTTCAAGSSVAANGSCLINVAFTPTATGARSASLSITHNAAASPSVIALGGTGTATAQPAISLNTSTLTFGAQTLGSTSAGQSVLVTNSGAAALNLSALTLNGTAATDFTRGGSCSPTSALAPGLTCTVTFTFTPGAVGARTATLSLASNAANGSAVLSLAGTGAAVATPGIVVAPGALAFGNQTVATTSAARSVTLTNNGSGALAITSVTASAGFAVTHNCGASVAAGASCTLSVTFAPTATGVIAGNVTIVSNAAGSPTQVGLSGTGVAASPVLAWSPATTSLAFPDTAVGATPATRALTLVNQGPGDLVLQQIGLAGAQAGDFSLGSAGSCVVNAMLAQGASCTLALAFQPGAMGARVATLQVTSSGTNPPDVALSGNGTAAAQPAVAVVPGALNFSVTASASTIDPQLLTLQNTGAAVLRVNNVQITAGSFTLAAAAANGCATAPFDLMPGQSCALSIGWSGPLTGTQAGTLELDSSAAATPMKVALQAVRETGAAPGTPELSNAGGGGCSIARGHSLADPTLWLLALLAGAVLVWRRAERRTPATLPPR
jgi:hypothetical protein